MKNKIKDAARDVWDSFNTLPIGWQITIAVLSVIAVSRLLG